MLKFCLFYLVGQWAPIHPVWALAAIHPRWGNRYPVFDTIGYPINERGGMARTRTRLQVFLCEVLQALIVMGLILMWML